MRKIKYSIKETAKKILPPILYELAKTGIRGKITFKPRWNTLSYEPLKGVQMFFDPSGSWQKKMVEGSYDRFLFERIRSLGAEGKTIYDIGSHIGYHAFYFAKLVGPKGHVHAFEPHPKNVERINLVLDKNPDLKKIISIHEVAIADSAGTQEFTMHSDIESGRSSGNFIKGADTFWRRDTYKDRGFTRHEVKTVTLDGLNKSLKINQVPDIIKLDIEGAEYLALQGARHTLLEKKPTLFIEIHSMKNMYDVMNFLGKLSYEIKIANIENNGVCYIEARPKTHENSHS